MLTCSYNTVDVVSRERGRKEVCREQEALGRQANNETLTFKGSTMSSAALGRSHLLLFPHLVGSFPAF